MQNVPLSFLTNRRTLSESQMSSHLNCGSHYFASLTKQTSTYSNFQQVLRKPCKGVSYRVRRKASPPQTLHRHNGFKSNLGSPSKHFSGDSPAGGRGGQALDLNLARRTQAAVADSTETRAPFRRPSKSSFLLPPPTSSALGGAAALRGLRGTRGSRSRPATARRARGSRPERRYESRAGLSALRPRAAPTSRETRFHSALPGRRRPTRNSRATGPQYPKAPDDELPLPECLGGVTSASFLKDFPFPRSPREISASPYPSRWAERKRWGPECLSQSGPHTGISMVTAAAGYLVPRQ